MEKAPFAYQFIVLRVKEKSKLPNQVKEPLRNPVTETNFDVEPEAKPGPSQRRQYEGPEGPLVNASPTYQLKIRLFGSFLFCKVKVKGVFYNWTRFTAILVITQN